MDYFQLTVLQFWRWLPHSFLALTNFWTAMLCCTPCSSVRGYCWRPKCRITSDTKDDPCREKKQKDQWLIFILRKKASYWHSQPLSWIPWRLLRTQQTFSVQYCMHCTLSVTSPEAERLFSRLKLANCQNSLAKLRTTMLDSRLSNLSVLSMDTVRASTLELDRVIDMFASKYPNSHAHLSV